MIEEVVWTVVSDDAKDRNPLIRNAPIEPCYYCGLENDRVEAGGVWYCPNRFCQGPGAFWLRTKAGYHGDDGILRAAKEAEMIADCAVAIEMEQEPRMRAALQRSLNIMVKRRIR